MQITFSDRLKAENKYVEPFIRHRFGEYVEIESIVLMEGSDPTPDYYLKEANTLLEVKRILQTDFIREITLSEKIKHNLYEEIKQQRYTNSFGYYIHVYPEKCPASINWKKLLSKNKNEFIMGVLRAISEGSQEINYKKSYIKAKILKRCFVKPGFIMFNFSEGGFFDVEGFIRNDVMRLIENAAIQLTNNSLKANKRILLLDYSSKNDQFNEWLLIELKRRMINMADLKIDEVWVGNQMGYLQLYP